MKKQIKAEPVLLVDSHHGIYVPEIFCKDVLNNTYRVNGELSDHMRENFNICADGPDHEEYWEAWDEILGRIELLGLNDAVYYLDQNEDLWAIPEGTTLEDSFN